MLTMGDSPGSSHDRAGDENPSQGAPGDTAAPGITRTSRGVRLVGGPMDGWFVKSDAPALREDWHTTWPWRLKLRWKPGHYVKASADKHGVDRAKWRPLGGDSQDKPSA